MDNTPYENLANAIVRQAAEDYIEELKQLKQRPKDRIAAANKSALERFFRPEWYHILTKLDSEYLISKLQEVVA